MSISRSDRAALTKVAQNDCQSTGIQNLPNEILEHIFLILNKPTLLEPDPFFCIEISLCISWVCSRWRAIALSSRKFWARCVNLESKLGTVQDEFIRRSDPWPLDLYGGFHIRTERLSTFTSTNVAQRIRSLRIHYNLKFVSALLNQGLPRLETIHVHSSVYGKFSISRSTLAQAHNVKDISCRYGVDFDFISFLDEPTSIHRLTSFEFLSFQSGPIRHKINTNYLLQFLAEAHNLKHLFLDFDIIPELPGVEWKGGEIKLTKVTEASLALSSQAAVAILPIISLSDRLDIFMLKISLDDLGHYPAIISDIERRVRHWDRNWNHSVMIKLQSDAAFSIEAFDAPTLDSYSVIKADPHFSLRVHYPSLEMTTLERLATKVTTYLVYPAIQALSPTILSTAWHVSIQKPMDVPLALKRVASSKNDLDRDFTWNLVDGLLNNETLSSMMELEVFMDRIPFIRHILNCVVDSMHEASLRGASEYSFLPNLRAIMFPVALNDAEGLSLCRDLIRADFFIELTWLFEPKITLPGRYKGERPVQKALETILRRY